MTPTELRDWWEPSSFELRPYQQEAVDAITAAWQRGVAAPLLHMATGLGKTIVFAELARLTTSRVLVLVHRDELLTQAVDKLRMVAGDIDIGIVKAASDDHMHRVVVASVQTLSRWNRLARVAADFDLVIVDECHHATATTYRRLLNTFGTSRVLGVTATPERADHMKLEDVWTETVYTKDLKAGIEEGYLSDLRAQSVRLAVDMDSIHTRAGDYIESEVQDAYLNADAPRHAVEAYQQHASGRKTIAFTSGVMMAHACATAFNEAGITAAALDATTPADDRHAILEQFARGEIRVVANCGILVEGFDEPSVECIIMARPTKSRPLYAQMIGRGTRRHPGKEDCLVIDLVGNSKRHSLVSLGSVFDKVHLLPGESFLEATARIAKVAEAHDGTLVSEAVNLLAGAFHWAGVQDKDFYVLACGADKLVIRRDADNGWALWRCTGKACVASGLTLEYARGLAEDMVRKNGSQGLVYKRAGWRKDPVSTKQREVLHQMYGTYPPADMTAGEASDAISLNTAWRVFNPPLATEKQRFYLKKAGYPVSASLTKSQASQLIGALKS